MEANSAMVGFPPPFVYLGFLFTGLAIDRIAALGALGLPLSLRLLLAAAAIGFGLSVGLSAMGMFRRAGTPPEPWREVSAFVTTGAYRFTRNPMYLGMAAIYLGLAVLADSIAALLLLPVVVLAIQTQVIAREEAYMGQRFGEGYDDYRKRVRRWI